MAFHNQYVSLRVCEASPVLRYQLPRKSGGWVVCVCVPLLSDFNDSVSEILVLDTNLLFSNSCSDHHAMSIHTHAPRTRTRTH